MAIKTPPVASKGTQTELAIRNESVQRIYNFYTNGLFFVNRRYQRKLIWTIEEKRAFVDSLVRGLPVPLILLAESEIQSMSAFEIIDGMQRLNAICSFIEGEFIYDGGYFDLETMVESKSRLDSGLLAQKKPKVDRKVCEIFASYVLPISIYSFTDPQKVDEIFIRINSYGKHLSRQELRAAGTLENFGDLVRVVSSEIRTDVSHSNILNLAHMKDISITNAGLDYGINVDDIFWVENNIITKEMVRESRDEEIIADLLSAMALPEIPGTSSGILDEYYGLKKSIKSEELDNALKKVGPDGLRSDFLRIHNVIRKVVKLSDKNFRELIFNESTQVIPRYYQTIFLALHKLIFKENKEVASYSSLIKKLTGISAYISIPEGGNWSSKSRNDNVNSVGGIIGSCFKDQTGDPAGHRWLTEFETLLMQSKTEQTSYDFKQGFTSLDGTKKIDQGSFDKIIKTLTAIANNSSKSVGYVCVGVIEKKKDAEKVKEIYGVDSVKYRNFYITGIEHEAVTVSKDLDAFFRLISQKVKDQPISDATKEMLLKNLRVINYFDKDILIFKTQSLNDPMYYDKKYYVRMGANVEEILPERYPEFFSQYKSS